MSSIHPSEVLARAQNAFREVFDQPSLVLKKEMTAHDVEGWDSLAHLRLIAALESEFKIRFSTQEIMSMDHVGTLLGLIENKK